MRDITQQANRRVSLSQKTAAIERPTFGRREKESPHPGEMECGLAKRRCGGIREEWEDEPPPNMRKGNYLPVSVVS